MPRYERPAASALGALLVVHLYGQAPAKWKDPSPHAARFVSVEKNVPLEVLDWGGRGRPIVFLAGGGQTAHVFDNFAPKLAATSHVTASRGEDSVCPVIQPRALRLTASGTTYWRCLTSSN